MAHGTIRDEQPIGNGGLSLGGDSRRERRQEYMAALEQASVEGSIEGFVRLIGRVMR